MFVEGITVLKLSEDQHFPFGVAEVNARLSFHPVFFIEFDKQWHYVISANHMSGCPLIGIHTIFDVFDDLI